GSCGVPATRAPRPRAPPPPSARPPPGAHTPRLRRVNRHPSKTRLPSRIRHSDIAPAADVETHPGGAVTPRPSPHEGQERLRIGGDHVTDRPDLRPEHLARLEPVEKRAEVRGGDAV